MREAGSMKQYKNLLGVTLGTGFGAGVVINQELLLGDNAAGGDIWCFRNKKYPEYIVEESVSIRAVMRVYAERSGDTGVHTPKEIFEIAEGICPGNREAAITAFSELGELAGDALASAITLIDGIIVIGGGLSGASKYILPALLKELNCIYRYDGWKSFRPIANESLSFGGCGRVSLISLKEELSRYPFRVPIAR